MILSLLALLTQIVAASFWLWMIVWGFWACVLARRHFSQPVIIPRDRKSPGVSILRPLCGVDVNLEANLNASFELDYPSYEVILSVADPKDPAVEVAKRVIKNHPEIESHLIIGDEPINVNPKINNLVRSYRKAKYDIVWICDSNILSDRDMLTWAIDGLQKPGVGLVHHTPQGAWPQTLGAELEQFFLNTAHAKIYLVINWTELDSCVMGKSTLFRKSDLDRVGGLESFGKYMAEDNMIGLALMKLGYKHFLGRKTAVQPLKDLSLKDYILRRSRWTRIRAYSMPIVTLSEPFTESIVNGLTGAYAAYNFFGVNPYIFFVLHMLYWLTVDYLLVSGLTQQRIPSLTSFFRVWILREISSIPIYLYAIFGSNLVVWRGREYQLKLGGTVEELGASTGKTKRRASFFVWDLILSVLSILTSPIQAIRQKQDRILHSTGGLFNDMQAKSSKI